MYVAAGIITRIELTLVIVIHLAILANDIRENHTNYHIHGASDQVSTRFVNEHR